jgi:hypothetical protein
MAANKRQDNTGKRKPGTLSMPHGERTALLGCRNEIFAAKVKTPSIGSIATPGTSSAGQPQPIGIRTEGNTLIFTPFVCPLTLDPHLTRRSSLLPIDATLSPGTPATSSLLSRPTAPPLLCPKPPVSSSYFRSGAPPVSATTAPSSHPRRGRSHFRRKPATDPPSTLTCSADPPVTSPLPRAATPAYRGWSRALSHDPCLEPLQASPAFSVAASNRCLYLAAAQGGRGPGRSDP